MLKFGKQFNQQFSLMALILIFGWISISNAITIQASKVLAETGIKNGLAVIYGTTDGKLEVDLGKSGNLLVRGIALDGMNLKKAQELSLSSGTHPIVSFQQIIETSKLPFGTSMVNLLVIDLNASNENGPSDAEIEDINTQWCCIHSLW